MPNIVLYCMTSCFEDQLSTFIFSEKMLLISLPPIVILLLSSSYPLVVTNCLCQLLVFLFLAHIPALLTGRMSYVDLAWPWGLVVLGLTPLISGFPEAWNLRMIMVMSAYVLAGLRMGLGAITLAILGHLKNELPRYQYQRIRWTRRGVTEETKLRYQITLQREILIQCLANMGVLATPLMLQLSGYLTGSLTMLEYIGWTMWLISFGFEHLADMQKINFLKECKKKNIRNSTCKVGLWQYCRHPNYFGEWMVWNSLVVTSIPSLLAMLKVGEEEWYTKGGLILGLLSVSWAMYQCLVNYTGVKPSEHYSSQKRPDYKEYQSNVNMFFPGPRKRAQE